MKRLLFVLAAIAAFSFPNLKAQTDMSDWKVGIMPGILQYHGPDGNEFFDASESTPAVSVLVGRVLNNSFDVEGTFTGGNLDYTYQNEAQEELETSYFDLNAQILYKFNNGYLLPKDFPVSPILFAGGGVSRTQPFDFGANAVVGGGLNFRFSELMNMQVRSQFKPNSDEEYNVIQHQVGFVFTLRKKDRAPLDSDGDGVADVLDKCPLVPGLEANKGCPEVDEETKEVMYAALRGIFFEIDKAKIKPESYPALNRVVDIMERHPEYNLYIAGHTSNTGTHEWNMDLSQRRAQAAVDYIVDHGIDRSRLRSAGFGETEPIATNETEEGRSMNRRVEFIVEF